MVTHQPGSIERSDPQYRFNFCGNHVAIDFTNTVGSRLETPEEHLNTYGDLLAWAEARHVLTRSQTSRLKQRAAVDPERARRALRRAIDFREALYEVLDRVARRRSPDAASLARLNRYVTETLSAAELSVSDGRVVLAPADADNLDAVVAAVVRAAIDLLTSDAVQRVGRCADETCGWIFFDTTRSGTRRWCEMKVCGNRNKVRRFRAT
jgi:predicted RNA-binding Zn ribbon-like protein